MGVETRRLYDGRGSGVAECSEIIPVQYIVFERIELERRYGNGSLSYFKTEDEIDESPKKKENYISTRILVRGYGLRA